MATTHYKSAATLLKEKAAAIDEAFEKFERFLKGEYKKETIQILSLKKIIGNYSIGNNDCYAQADHLFHLNRTWIYYRDLSIKIQNWFGKIVKLFKEYEKLQKQKVLCHAKATKVQKTPSVEIPSVEYNALIQANRHLLWYFDPGDD